MEYITNPEYQDELANTDADIYLYKAPKNIPELYSLKEQLEEAGISDEWDELWGVLETYTKLLKDSKNSIPTGTLEIFINILNLSELSSYGSQKKDVLKRSIPLDYEIYGEKSHADSAIDVYKRQEVQYALGLASSCFVLEPYEDGIRAVVKGIGHGYGLSQATANEKAKEGRCV